MTAAMTRDQFRAEAEILRRATVRLAEKIQLRWGAQATQPFEALLFDVRAAFRLVASQNIVSPDHIEAIVEALFTPHPCRFKASDLDYLKAMITRKVANEAARAYVVQRFVAMRDQQSAGERP